MHRSSQPLPIRTLIISQLLTDYHNQTGAWGGCQLTGISLSGGRHLGNLGSIILAALAIVTAAFLVLKSDKKKAAVGRRYVKNRMPQLLIDTNKSCREMQVFLIGYIIISICEIFSVGEFPLSGKVRVVSCFIRSNTDKH